jgi:hypothetical protein
MTDKNVKCKCGGQIKTTLKSNKNGKCDKCGKIDTIENFVLEFTGINKQLENIKDTIKRINKGK